MKHLAILALALCSISAAKAGNWPQWRGPLFNGSTDRTGLPAKWSKNGEYRLGSADLPERWRASTPIVWENRVFLSGVDAARDTLRGHVLRSGKDGKLLWSRDVAKGVRRDEPSNYASSSPFDRRKAGLVLIFGTGDLVCLRFRWRPTAGHETSSGTTGRLRSTGPSAAAPCSGAASCICKSSERDVPVPRARPEAGGGSSPICWPSIPVRAGRCGGSVRPARPQAPKRTESYTTPLPVTYQGTDAITDCRGRCISGHDPATGKELWRWGNGTRPGKPIGRSLPRRSSATG